MNAATNRKLINVCWLDSEIDAFVFRPEELTLNEQGIWVHIVRVTVNGKLSLCSRWDEFAYLSRPIC